MESHGVRDEASTDGTGILPGVGDPAVYGKRFSVDNGIAESSFLVVDEHVEVINDMAEVAADNILELEMTNEEVGVGRTLEIPAGA